ncbi:MAG: glutamate-5-semialdehyde dehydrogenase [Bacteroidales bacterium]|nr:glutamate-5-semialdehyde dehydrogenase [Bacteroidales bacterium]
MHNDINDMLKAAAKATESVAALTLEQTNAILMDVAARLREESDAILAANRLDTKALLADRIGADSPGADRIGTDSPGAERIGADAAAADRQAAAAKIPGYDRLLLTSERISSIASDMEKVATLSSPLGRVLDSFTRPDGMKITKMSVPLGVVGVIYEARPNVTPDVFSLCLKSGNVCVLKGGSEAEHTNRCIVGIIASVLERHGVDTAACTLLPSSREAVSALLDAVGIVDVIIPRGSARLISFVRDNARVPVIETGAGICHTYFDRDGDLAKGAAIVNNAKTRRVSVCNALDCLIVHGERLSDLPALCSPLQENDVVIYADERAFAALEGRYPSHLLNAADDSSFGTEYLDYKMSIRVVDSVEEAIAHIGRYGSRHSECIVSENRAAVELFWKRVDAACVYANVSTAFTDGAQFGFGAEIGISTQKLHARGPMALNELTTYKYLIEGNGQIRR